MARLTIKGGAELSRALKQAGDLANKALASAMVEEQEKVMAVAKERTPVEFGTLKGSGTVLPPKMGGSRVEVQSGFGGAASDYAIYVHENLEARHNVGQAKFLESAFLDRVPAIPRNLAKGVERAWQRLSR